MEHFEGIESYSVKHLPIVKAYAERLGLVELINHLVPSQMELPPGIFFLGMVLDTLSGRNPLYRLEHFFQEQDTELLLGKEVDPKSFNDVNVGRFLDKVFGHPSHKPKSSLHFFGIKSLRINSKSSSPGS